MTKTTSIILAVTAALLAAAIGAAVAYVATSRLAVTDATAQVEAVEAQHEAEAALEAAEAVRAEIEAELAALEEAPAQVEADAVVASEPITTDWLDLHPYSDWRATQREGWEPTTTSTTTTQPPTTTTTQPTATTSTTTTQPPTTTTTEFLLASDEECSSHFGWHLRYSPDLGCHLVEDDQYCQSIWGPDSYWDESLSDAVLLDLLHYLPTFLVEQHVPGDCYGADWGNLADY